MSRIDRLNAELEDILLAKGKSEEFDQQIVKVEALVKRATMAARGDDAGGFLVDKAFRALHVLKFEYGHQKVKCVACNGSGRYDHNGSPKCGSCGGSRKTRMPGPHAYQTLKR